MLARRSGPVGKQLRTGRTVGVGFLDVGMGRRALFDEVDALVSDARVVVVLFRDGRLPRFACAGRGLTLLLRRSDPAG